LAEPIVLLGLGVVTPVGLGPHETGTSVRAGTSRVREIDEAEWCGRDGNPYRGGFLTAKYLDKLHRKTRGVAVDSLPGRTLQLGGAAVRQLAPVLASLGIVPALVLGIGDPAQAPDGSPAQLLENLMRQAQVRLRLETSEVVAPGRAAGLLAIHRAIQRLDAGEPGPILAGGVDSYFDAARLERLDVEGRLLNDVNLDGFLPGEGAAVVLLSKDPVQVAGSPPLGRLLAPRVGFERGHLRSTEPLLGDGLSETLATVLSAVPPASLPCGAVYMNLNGERLGAKEWGVAQLRNKRFFADDLEQVHPGECTGDAGAAMGPLLVALAATGFKDRPGLALVWCASDEADRVALCVAP